MHGTGLSRKIIVSNQSSYNGILLLVAGQGVVFSVLND